MTTPHKHAALIKLWADGAQIQYKTSKGIWCDVDPSWDADNEYRVKPAAIVRTYYVHRDGIIAGYLTDTPNLRLTLDAETGALKSAEVIK